MGLSLIAAAKQLSERDAAFDALADAQRGQPEEEMLLIQNHPLGPGLYGFLCEHVGDLTHRMSENFDFLEGNYGAVKEKVDKTLGVLTRPYGVERKIEQNRLNNYSYHQEKGSLPEGATFDDMVADLRSYGRAYANAHSQLKTHNYVQRAARDAAVAIGHEDYDAATSALETLDSILKKGPEVWAEEAGRYGNASAKPRSKEAKTSAKHANTQINFPKELAWKFHKLAEKIIPESDLMADGYEDSLHITVKYGVEENEQKMIEAVGDQEPFIIRFGKTHVFDPSESSDGAAPVVVRVEAPELRRLHDRIDKAISVKEDNFDYHPHATLAYVKPEAASKYEGLDYFEGIEFEATNITLSKKDRIMITVDFGHTPKTAANSDAASSITLGVDYAAYPEFPVPVIVRYPQKGMRWRSILKVVKQITGEIMGQRVPWKDIYVWESPWGTREEQETQFPEWAANRKFVMYDILEDGTHASVGKVHVPPPLSEKTSSHKVTPLSDTVFENPEIGEETNAYADIPERVKDTKEVPPLMSMVPEELKNKEAGNTAKAIHFDDTHGPALIRKRNKMGSGELYPLPTLEQLLKTEGGLYDAQGGWDKIREEARARTPGFDKLPEGQQEKLVDEVGMEHLRQAYGETEKRLRSLRFPLTVYRAICGTDLRNINPAYQGTRGKGIGVYWSYEEANAYVSQELAHSCKDILVFRGVLHDGDEIDWAFTTWSNLVAGDEREIRLSPGAKIEIMGWKKRGESEWRKPSAKLHTVTAAGLFPENLAPIMVDEYNPGARVVYGNGSGRSGTIIEREGTGVLVEWDDGDTSAVPMYFLKVVEAAPFVKSAAGIDFNAIINGTLSQANLPVPDIDWNQFMHFKKLKLMQETGVEDDDILSEALYETVAYALAHDIMPNVKEKERSVAGITNLVKQGIWQRTDMAAWAVRRITKEMPRPPLQQPNNSYSLSESQETVDNFIEQFLSWLKSEKLLRGAHGERTVLSRLKTLLQLAAKHGTLKPTVLLEDWQLETGLTKPSLADYILRLRRFLNQYGRETEKKQDFPFRLTAVFAEAQNSVQHSDQSRNAVGMYKTPKGDPFQEEWALFGPKDDQPEEVEEEQNEVPITSPSDMKSLLNRTAGLSNLESMGLYTAESATAPGYEMYLVGAKDDPEWFELALQQSEHDASDIQQQHQKPTPKALPRQELKEILDGWLRKYRKIHIMSYNEKYLAGYVRLLQRLGYKVNKEAEPIEDKPAFYISAAKRKFPPFEQWVKNHPQFDLKSDIDVYTGKPIVTEEFDPTGDMVTRSQIEERYRENAQWLSDLRLPLEIYRALEIEDPDARPDENAFDIDFDKLGIYWTWVENSAEAYFGSDSIWNPGTRPRIENSKLAIIKAVVTKPGDIDFDKTLLANMTNPEENEITLRPGAKLRLVGMDWGEGYKSPLGGPHTVTAASHEKAEGEHIVAALKETFPQFDIKLVGSVAEKGESEHDFDILIAGEGFDEDSLRLFIDTFGELGWDYQGPTHHEMYGEAKTFSKGAAQHDLQWVDVWFDEAPSLKTASKLSKKALMLTDAKHFTQDGIATPESIEDGFNREPDYDSKDAAGKSGLRFYAAASTLKQALMSLRPQMAAAAQKVYDEWAQDEEGYDEEFAGGGICDEISRAIGDVAAGQVDADFADGGQEGDDHAWLIAYNDNEAYGLDIPHGIYETGGGYAWAKIPNVRFDADDVEIFPVEIDREHLSKYAKGRTIGQAYLLHFDEPIGGERHKARHYLGWAEEAQKRIEEHYQGRGAKITQALRNMYGYTFTVARIWDGVDRAFERRLKSQGGLSRHCPICKAEGLIPPSRQRETSLTDVQVVPETMKYGPDYVEIDNRAEKPDLLAKNL